MLPNKPESYQLVEQADFENKFNTAHHLDWLQLEVVVMKYLQTGSNPEHKSEKEQTE